MKKRSHNDFEDDFEAWLHEKTRAAGPDVSPEFLAAQRRGIYRRMDESRSGHAILRWALSLAMLLVIVAGGITTYERAYEHRSKSAPTISDEQLFSDLSAMEQRTEPKAILPIQGLFQE
jgi:predicted acetyltransferase